MEFTGFTIDIDTGGTFTDGFITADDRFELVKVDTTPLHLGWRDAGKGEIIDSINPRKVHAVAAWDDSLPLFFRLATLSLSAFRLILGKLNHRFMSKS